MQNSFRMYHQQEPSKNNPVVLDVIPPHYNVHQHHNQPSPPQSPNSTQHYKKECNSPLTSETKLNTSNSPVQADPNIRRYRTAFTREQLGRLEKNFIKKITFRGRDGVWFQNRRMKDKRQRMAIAWPYAAVYTDPAFAASLLQAAASSLPLHYPPPPPVYPHHYPRYNPWSQSFGLPQAGIPLSNPALNLNQNITSVPQSLPPQHPIPQGLNLNLGLDFSPYPMKMDGHTKLSPRVSPTHSDISLSPAPEGLLIPAKEHQTNISIPEKPKLFKPYKSET
ncbi:hypothetical protein FQR65_LT05890 [Abscondita terminalis]|nr:hypothetical protein FQR65_LT05890 [Abscondita terminalis]